MKRNLFLLLSIGLFALGACSPMRDELGGSTGADSELIEEGWLAEQGRTDDGRATLGNPSAPVKLVDYTDFM